MYEIYQKFLTFYRIFSGHINKIISHLLINFEIFATHVPWDLKERSI